MYARVTAANGSKTGDSSETGLPALACSPAGLTLLILNLYLDLSLLLPGCTSA
jgi:hypothetical protein